VLLDLDGWGPFLIISLNVADKSTLEFKMRTPTLHNLTELVQATSKLEHSNQIKK